MQGQCLPEALVRHPAAGLGYSLWVWGPLHAKISFFPGGIGVLGFPDIYLLIILFSQPDSLLGAVTFSLGDGSELVPDVVQPVVPLSKKNKLVGGNFPDKGAALQQCRMEDST